MGLDLYISSNTSGTPIKLSTLNYSVELRIPKLKNLDKNKYWTPVYWVDSKSSWSKKDVALIEDNA